MPRTKKAPVKVPVKRTRRPKDPDATNVKPAPIPEAWIDEQLRKECLGIAAANGSSITSLVEDAQGIYTFIKGNSSTSGSLKYTEPQPLGEPPLKNNLLHTVMPEEDLAIYGSPRTSKLDAHTL